MPDERKPSPLPSPSLWFAALALAACHTSTEPLPSDRFTVEPYLVPCEGEASFSCMMVAEADSAQSGLFYSSIDGFDFEWGYRQILQVDRRRIPDPPADGSSIAYTLVKVLAKTPVPDWSFRLVLADTSEARLSGDTLSITGYTRPILVDAPEDRLKLKGSGAAYLDLRVRAGGTGSGALQGDSVRVLRRDSTGRLVPE